MLYQLSYTRVSDGAKIAFCYYFSNHPRKKYPPGNIPSLPRDTPDFFDLQDISFLNDRFRDGKSYIPFSYFVGASPENGYTPRQPFTLLVGSNHTSYVEDGYCKLFIPCGGADDPRPIKLRRKGNGQWFLWEQYLMTGIRIPTSADPWA